MDSRIRQIRNLETTLPTSQYFKEYRDVKRFLKCCMLCGNYGQCWACPPFEQEWETILSRYNSVTIFVTQITFSDRAIPLEETTTIIRPVREQIEQVLRKLEQERNGMAFAYAGTCLYCPEGKCSRLQGKPCRHPDLVRPSLEAIGFDIGMTVRNLFGLELIWSKDNTIPENQLLVSGLFHND